MGKGIVAFNCRIARAQLVQWTKASRGMNMADRLGVNQRRVKLQRLSSSDVTHSQVTDIKLQWRLPRLLSIDNQFCIRKDKVGDRDAHLVALAAQAAYFRPIFFRRNIHRKSAHVDRIQLHRLTKQVAQRSLEMEFRNIEQRLNAWLSGIGIGRAIDLESLTRNVKPIRDPNVKLRKFHATLETSRQRLDHSTAQDWLRADDENWHAD